MGCGSASKVTQHGGVLLESQSSRRSAGGVFFIPLPAFELGLGVLEPVAGAVGIEDLNPEGQTVEHGTSEQLAPHDLGPFLERQFGGQEETGRLVGPSDDIEEQIGDVLVVDERVLEALNNNGPHSFRAEE